MLSAADLLDFLSRRGGQEYRAAVTSARPTTPVTTRSSGAISRDVGEYRFTVRGEHVQATGPGGQTRLLSRAAFGDIFGNYRFREPVATGQRTDLGPLFG